MTAIVDQPFFLPTLFFILLSLLLFKKLSKSHDTGTVIPKPRPQFPIIGHMHLIEPLIHQSLHRLSLRYGPIFSIRLGSVQCVAVSSPHLAKQVLNNNESFFDWRFLSKAIDCYSQGRSFGFAPFGPYWKLISQMSRKEFLGARKVSYFQAARDEECRRFLKLLAQKAEAGEVVNMSREVLKFNNNIICRMALGRVVEAWPIVRQVNDAFNLFNLADFIWLFNKLDLHGIEKKMHGLVDRFHAVLEEVIAQQEEERKKYSTLGEEREIKSFLDALLDYSEKETAAGEVKLSRVHIKAVLADFFAAGLENLVIATEWCLAELINHPKIMEKARQEIKEVTGNSRIIEESDGPSLPYMQAIFKESNRLHAALPVSARRCIQDCKIDGQYVIRKNTVVFVNLWAMGRDPKYWESPSEFRPERFYRSKEEAELVDQPINNSYLPFGSGRRACPGMSLASQEIPAVIASLIQCFDFQIVGPQGEKLRDGTLDMTERPGLTIPRANNLMCVPIARCNVMDMVGSV